MSKDRDNLYIIHIAECLRDIRAMRRPQAALNNGLAKDATLRQLQVMAESTQRLSDAITAQYPQVDWRGWTGFRNVLTHGYLEIELDLVWKVIEQDIPMLEKVIDELIQHRKLPLTEPPDA